MSPVNQIDFTPEAVQLPSPVVNMATSLSRDLLKAAAAWMVGHGALSSGSSTQFESIGLGVILWGLTIVWSMVEKQLNHKTAVAAVAQAKAS